MNLTDLIKSAERKIADPTTTPQTVERERAIAHYLTSMQAEIEIKDSTLAGYRKENLMLYTEAEIQRRYTDMVSRCDELWAAPGWESSPGCRAEIQEAARLGMPIRYLTEE